MYDDLLRIVLKDLAYLVSSRDLNFIHYSIEDSWPEVYSAPEPSVILWRNLSVGPVNRFCRTIIVSIVTLILLALSIFCIVVTKYYQDQYSAKYNLNSCGNIQVT